MCKFTITVLENYEATGFVFADLIKMYVFWKTDQVWV